MTCPMAPTSPPAAAMIAPPPQLAALGLSEEALQALRRQGFIAREYRGPRGPFFKLRFRIARRQIVRYVGQDAALAAQLELELQAWQAGRHAELALARLCVAARQMLRDTKQELTVPLEQVGYRFHGLAIRAKSKCQ